MNTTMVTTTINELSKASGNAVVVYIIFFANHPAPNCIYFHHHYLQ
jgi:hypothetical protein